MPHLPHYGPSNPERTQTAIKHIYLLEEPGSEEVRLVCDNCGEDMVMRSLEIPSNVRPRTILWMRNHRMCPPRYSHVWTPGRLS
jgi:hypothetical protein